MKKRLSLLLIVVLAFTLLVACTDKEASAETKAEESVAVESSDAAEEDVAEADTNVLIESANNYFANFPDHKNMLNAETDVVDKIIAGEELFILDIRSAEDFAKGHLIGAYNVPYGEVASALDTIPDDQEIYVMCYSGQTSSQIDTKGLDN